MKNTHQPIVVIDAAALERSLGRLTGETQGKARRDTLVAMTRYFTSIINLADRGTGFPRWPASMTRLMELAWTLFHLRCLRNAATGELLTMRRIAELLCLKMHRKMPSNPYHAAWQSRHTGSTLVEVYSGMLAHGFTLGGVLDWSESLQFPYFKSYRGVFS